MERPKAPDTFILALRKYIETVEDEKAQLEEKDENDEEIEKLDEEISETESVLDYLGEA